MKVLGGSSAGPLTEFLHVGYLSAMAPQEPSFPSFAAKEILFQADVDQALASEPTTGAIAAPGAGLIVTPAGVDGYSAAHPWPQPLALVAMLLVLRLLRSRVRASTAKVAALAFTAALVLLASSFPATFSARAAGAAHAGRAESGRRYLHPQLATKVLMHGLLVDALREEGDRIGAGAAMDRRAGVQLPSGLPEGLRLGFPTAAPSPNMKHAVDHYRIDGWGRPFRLRWRLVTAYTSSARDESEVLVGKLTSAGPDGQLDTSDDISADIVPGSVPGRVRRLVGEEIGEAYGPYRWKPGAGSYFIRKVDDAPTLFFRRPLSDARGPTGGRSSRPADQMTGQDYFDFIPTEIYRDKKRSHHAGLAEIQANLKKIYDRESGGKAGALVLVVVGGR